ncbi:uncharacterized protein A1O9_12391 [Exophiala aquamarina CBS 119918]|uniref:Uncharacterized protein n=1 Tax=Exophiala aquamarina CBS 119918 TaxID=1182545 RepID=A0A072NUC9_9EURO|nr:uncharacterized protein A1O9_12391 [Exophiala aquamarina CBS 119918]KEF51474.1 hypothetical protein A1O9_12391 [Exophiala aquamarina CBS 119918]
MAQLGQSLRYVCRGCRTQRHESAKSASSRFFSSTPQRLKSMHIAIDLFWPGQDADVSIAIPNFVPTASPEFDELLADLRQRVFLPAALSPQHQKLIFRRRHDELLNKDPGITVAMDDGEEIRLRPTKSYDKPALRDYTKQLLSLLEASSSTWSNLSPFLQGLVLTKQNTPEYFWERLTRKAGEMGKEGVLLDCARSAEKTNFRLCRPRVAREFFIAFHKQAAAGEFKGAKLETAWKRAQTAALMLESEEHLHLKSLHDVGAQPGDRKPRPQPQVDARSDPLVLATLLELCAHTAVKDGTDDLRRQVTSFAGKLAYVIQDTPVEGPKEPKVESELQRLASMSNELETELIMQGAIETALTVGSIADTDEDVLKGHLEVLTKKIEEKEKTLRAAAVASGRSRRSLEMYDQLHPSQ